MITCWIICAAVSLGIRSGCHGLHGRHHETFKCMLHLNKYFLFSFYYCISHLPDFFFQFQCIPSVTVSSLVLVLISIGRHDKTSFKLPQSSKQQGRIFFPLASLSFPRQPQLSQLNLNAMLLAPGLFDYPQTGSCAGFHSFHHALTSVSWLCCRILREVILVPLPYAGDFGCLSPV